MKRMVSKCPGQNTQFWGPDDIFTIECPKCGNAVEFFKDDIRRRCKNCSHMFLNPRLNLGCAGWCQYADQCIGTMGKEEFKDILTSAIKEYFKGEDEKMGHALKILGFAEKILETEEGNPKVVIASAILYDIGIYEHEKVCERSHITDQEKNEFSIVREILKRSGAKKEIADEVCRIIEYHGRSHKISTLNGKIVHDAVQLANLPESLKTEKRTFFTSAGQKMAEDI
jgi:ribosomal protein S27E